MIKITKKVKRKIYNAVSFLYNSEIDLEDVWTCITTNNKEYDINFSVTNEKISVLMYDVIQDIKHSYTDINTEMLVYTGSVSQFNKWK
jgi:hypothetical protein